MIVLTADLHLGHENILRYCAETRGQYKDVWEMGRAYLEELEKFRGADLYYLGDLTMNRRVAVQAIRMLMDLFPRVWFLFGNHDKRSVIEEAVPMWQGDLLDKKLEGTRVVLCHYPLESWAARSHGTLHFHGHSHGASREVVGRLDVGVDSAMKLLGAPRPFTLDEAVELARRER